MRSARAWLVVTTLSCLVAALGTLAPATAVGSSSPVNVVRPSVAGTVAPGHRVRCDVGTWTGHPSAFAYRWRRDGRTVAGQTRSRYPVTRRDADSRLACAVKPAGAARAAASLAVAVTSVPTNATPPVVTSDGDVLSCSPGTWSDDVDDLVYGWTRNGSPVDGAVTSTLTTSGADVDAGFACLVAGHNAAGTSGRVSSAVFTLGVDGGSTSSLAPVVVTAPSLAFRSGRFACTPGTWANDPTTFVYSWTRNGSPVPGATSSTLATTDSDAGAWFACLVAGRNSAGASGYVTSPLVVAGTTPTGPPVTSVPTSSVAPSLVQLGTTLTCAPGTWSGADSLAFAWTRNGSPTNQIGRTVDVAGDVDATYACLVRGSNAAGTSGYVSSNLVTVVADATPPTPAAFSVVPVTTGDFGAYAIGASTTLDFTVTNTSANSGTVTASLGGASAAEFGISASTCPAPLPGGTSCTVTVSFTPTSNGDKTATLVVPGAPGGSTALTALAAPPGITLFPVAYDYGSTSVGSSTTATFRAVNTTGTSEHVRGASVHGAGFGFNFGPDFTCVFAVSDLSPHRSCTISITFRPQSPGPFSAVIGVIGDTVTPTATVSGTGVPSTSLRFGAPTHRTSAGLARSVTLRNGRPVVRRS